MSNSTSSLPFAGRLPYRADITARVLTVESRIDWNVRIGGSAASRFWRASLDNCRCNARVRRLDWRAPLTGNELYLKGLNSGITLSQAVLANAGNIAGHPAIP